MQSESSIHAPRLLHAMLRVRDLERSLAFYARWFDLVEQRRIHFPEIPRTLVFLGNRNADAAAMQLELWFEPGAAIDMAPPQSTAARAGHVGIGVRDIHGLVAALGAAGVPVHRLPAALRPGGRVIAMIDDPDGHELELLADD